MLLKIISNRNRILKRDNILLPLRNVSEDVEANSGKNIIVDHNENLSYVRSSQYLPKRNAGIGVVPPKPNINRNDATARRRYFFLSPDLIVRKTARGKKKTIGPYMSKKKYAKPCQFVKKFVLEA